MIDFVVILHLLIAIAMILLILLQKTEGNASGAGFSGSASVETLMRPRARTNPITNATAILGICFFVTSLGLAILARPASMRPTSIMSEPTPTNGPVVPKVDDTPVPPAGATPPAAPAGPVVPNH